MYVLGTEQGGLFDISRVVDQQEGPTCGFEAVETVIQLFRPAGDDLSQRLLPSLAYRNGHLMQDEEGYSLAIAGIRPLLQAFRIPATWSVFDHNVLISALHNDRVVIAVVDANILDPGTYGEPQSWHAIVLTNYVLDARGHVVGYVGADSNYSHQERWWPHETVRLAAKACRQSPLLITQNAARWAARVSHYRLVGGGRALPVTKR